MTNDQIPMTKTDHCACSLDIGHWSLGFGNCIFDFDWLPGDNEIMLQPFSLDRLVRAVEKVRERLLRATAALQQAGVPYAVAGGNAVAAWVARVDEAAVRNTRDVDLLLRRDDLEAAKTALAAAGFIYRHVKSVDIFLDGPHTKARDAVRIVFAQERVHDDDLLPLPDVIESVDADHFRVLSLEALVRAKLTAYLRKDQTEIDDLIDIGLIDATWPARLPPELAQRLQQLLDTPNG
jgi:hypothetical protein